MAATKPKLRPPARIQTALCVNSGIPSGTTSAFDVEVTELVAYAWKRVFVDGDSWRLPDVPKAVVVNVSGSTAMRLASGCIRASLIVVLGRSMSLRGARRKGAISRVRS